MNRRDLLYLAAGAASFGLGGSFGAESLSYSATGRSSTLIPDSEPNEVRGETSSGAAGAQPSIPIIHYTDLFHPPDDPDDHVDLATLFALPELDIRAIILDLGHNQRAKPGEIPVKQMMALTGKKVAYAVGLAGPLRYPEDKAENQSRRMADGVELILRVLRESDQKVIINATGSMRDVAAAFNRDEALVRSKVARIYMNAGNSAPGDVEWNTVLDPQAYIRMMRSDLPVYWCPCFGGRIGTGLSGPGEARFREYQTHWKFRQADVYESLATPLQNFLLYALGHKVVSLDDPIAYLSRNPEPELKQREWVQTRHMWCTGPMIHAAGRGLYRNQDCWAALSSRTPEFQPSPVYEFVPASVTIDRDLQPTLKLSGATGNFRVFHILDSENYEKAMTTSLRGLLAGMPLASGLS